MTKIYRVFLSSTGKDLADYRQTVFEALQRKPDVKVVRMEDFVAENGKPKDICDREVGTSDILVGLIGFCYGASPPSYKRSFTHLEIDEAVGAKLPCLMHIAPDGVEFPAHTREPDELYRRVNALRKKLLKDHTVGQKSAWKSADALAAHVSEAVERALDRLRADSVPGFNVAKHEVGLKDRRAAIIAMLEQEDAQRDLLLREKEEVENKLRNLEASYGEAKAKIAELEVTLDRFGTDIGGDRLAEARTALEAGDFSKADEIFAEVQVREQIAVERTAEAAFGQGQIAEEQVRWADAAEHYAKAARLVPDSEDLAGPAAIMQWRIGCYYDALSIARKRLDYAEQNGDPSMINKWLSHVGIYLQDLGYIEQAEDHLRRAVESNEESLGSEHPSYAVDLNNLARLLRDTGRHTEAESLFQHALEIDKAALGEAHPSYAIRLNNLAILLRDTGRYDEAEPLFRQALETTRAALGEGHPAYAVRLRNLAVLLETTDRTREAEPLYRQALEIRKVALGEAHPDCAQSLSDLAGLLRATGRYEEAEPLYAQMMLILRERLGDDHPNTMAGAANYARLLREHSPDDPALAELQATFGADIGR